MVIFSNASHIPKLRGVFRGAFTPEALRWCIGVMRSASAEPAFSMKQHRLVADRARECEDRRTLDEGLVASGNRSSTTSVISR